ncbi:hypothetical protein BD779DRAFT_1215262 [Infundibulicybe gibba]|nr:hypothetical protein BD779DRAFT_1215262 [Infundibulicybe gibba]
MTLKTESIRSGKNEECMERYASWVGPFVTLIVRGMVGEERPREQGTSEREEEKRCRKERTLESLKSEGNRPGMCDTGLPRKKTANRINGFDWAYKPLGSRKQPFGRDWISLMLRISFKTGPWGTLRNGSHTNVIPTLHTSPSSICLWFQVLANVWSYGFATHFS